MRVVAVERRGSEVFMKLHARFVQLPIQFDAERLAEEVSSLGENSWMPHPQGYEGNDFLPLISAHGDPRNEGFAGPMRPTPHLSAHQSYMMQTLASLGAVMGRTRLMRLSGHAEVNEHADVNYYWRDRVRVHIPIITQPTVTFHCGNEVVHMKAGECWVFDTWSQHKVINDAERSRIHLVADTVGGEGFWNLVSQGRATGFPEPNNWTKRKIPPSTDRPFIDFESVNVPVVMSPWELREHINFLLAEALPHQSMLPVVIRITIPFLQNWRTLWSAHGDAEGAWPRYRQLVASLLSDLAAARADNLMLQNGIDFFAALNSMVLSVALSGRQSAPRMPTATQ